ncbi:uncharacterized protein LOC107466193 [Arachis duranensis]|uniref:Uncharacterized protein LOC107466193 n=1 Tax=Arachis duranensis TaxID=130453 RepID=A0A9C6T9W9_ARADU|nr:uncharacterized protein LOC107466193 [Arachis duranensis]
MGGYPGERRMVEEHEGTTITTFLVGLNPPGGIAPVLANGYVLCPQNGEPVYAVALFVDKHGFVKERLIDVVHVKDTTSATLKQEICYVLSHHNLNIQNVRGQGYDGTSNMRGEWKGLQALIIQECPYAYYVHCFAHQLQLALVAAAKEVVDVHAFFQSLSNIINVVCSSCKRNDELRSAYATKIFHLVATNQIETGRGANQIGTLKRSGDTRWSSHFNSICSLLRMFGATTSVLEDLATNESTYSQRGDATYALKSLLSFDFVFILHMMKEIMGITDKLCQALQQKSQDILNAMHLIPDMGASFSDIIRSRRKKDVVTIEHHYRVDIFTSVIDFQLKELNSRFSEQATEFLILSTSLDPKDAFKLFSVCNICNLAKNFYSLDFSEQEKIQLDYELQHYELDVVKAPDFQNLSTLAELYQKLTETGKSNIYPLIDRLIRLVLTLPVTTATIERAFSAMKIIKTRLRNKMEDEFLADCMIVKGDAQRGARRAWRRKPQREKRREGSCVGLPHVRSASVGTTAVTASFHLHRGWLWMRVEEAASAIGERSAVDPPELLTLPELLPRICCWRTPLLPQSSTTDGCLFDWDNVCFDKLEISGFG